MRGRSDVWNPRVGPLAWNSGYTHFMVDRKQRKKDWQPGVTFKVVSGANVVFVSVLSREHYRMYNYLVELACIYENMLLNFL